MLPRRGSRHPLLYCIATFLRAFFSQKHNSDSDCPANSKFQILGLFSKGYTKVSVLGRKEGKKTQARRKELDMIYHSLPLQLVSSPLVIYPTSIKTRPTTPHRNTFHTHNAFRTPHHRRSNPLPPIKICSQKLTYLVPLPPYHPLPIPRPLLPRLRLPHPKAPVPPIPPSPRNRHPTTPFLSLSLRRPRTTTPSPHPYPSHGWKVQGGSKRESEIQHCCASGGFRGVLCPVRRCL